MDYQVSCPHCMARVGVMAVQIGQTLRCPHCREIFTVSMPSGVAVGQGRPFTFTCDQCRSRLEAYPDQVGQVGLCPTCGVEFTIPQPMSRTRRTGGTEPENEYAQPVHAYAAAGEKAPRILRTEDGAQVIQCPRCSSNNPVSVNNCRQCAMPFTLEGSEVSAPSETMGLQAASLVLGIVGLFTFCLALPSLLAVVLGILSVRGQWGPHQSFWRLSGAWGILLGGLGLLICAAFWLVRPW